MSDSLTLHHRNNLYSTTDIQVEFRIDTSNAQDARPTLDWNSKKAGELFISEWASSSMMLDYR